MPPETRIIHKRGSWSAQEDQKLLELVEDSKSVRWVNIAEMLGSRTSKQCRERYHQNLKPSLDHSPITPEEGKQIDQLVSIYGKRWAEISRHLKGRSDNAIKNWWNASANRRRSQSWRNMGAGTPGYVHHPTPYVDEYGPRRHSIQPEYPRAQSIGGPTSHHPSPRTLPGPQGPPGFPGPSHIPAQVGVVFNQAYSEEPMPTARRQSTVSPSLPPACPLSNSIAPVAPIPPLTTTAPSPCATCAAGPTAPSGPSYPQCPSCPAPTPRRTSIAAGTSSGPPSTAHTPSAHHYYPHTNPHHAHPPAHRFPSHAQHLLSSQNTHSPYSRLPAIEPYLEERWRSLRKQSLDSNDLSRYSLSASSYPSSPETRRSSHVGAFAPHGHWPPRSPSPLPSALPPTEI